MFLFTGRGNVVRGSCFSDDLDSNCLSAKNSQELYQEPVVCSVRQKVIDRQGHMFLPQKTVTVFDQ